MPDFFTLRILQGQLNAEVNTEAAEMLKTLVGTFNRCSLRATYAEEYEYPKFEPHQSLARLNSAWTKFNGVLHQLLQPLLRKAITTETPVEMFLVPNVGVREDSNLWKERCSDKPLLSLPGSSQAEIVDTLSQMQSTQGSCCVTIDLGTREFRSYAHSKTTAPILKSEPRKSREILMSAAMWYFLNEHRAFLT